MEQVTEPLFIMNEDIHEFSSAFCRTFYKVLLEVYHAHFMCNVQFVHQYENLWPYLRDLYGLPGVAETVNLNHIKEHYYTTHPDATPSGIVARGPDIDFEAPHDRDELTDDLRPTGLAIDE